MKKFSPFFYLLLINQVIGFANPQDATVVAGKAEIAQKTAKHLQISASDKTIINWKDFSIPFDELTEFLQPGTDSVILNRVVGGNLSKIMGQLEANGKVYLINPNGLLVGPDSVINVGEFVASTLDILNDNFLSNCCGNLFKGDSKAEIINLGRISAWDGDVYLIGYRVNNEGDIQAPHGQVGLAAAQEVYLKPSGQDRLFIRSKLDGDKEDGEGITNSGTISALEAHLKAEGNPYAKAIHHKGKADALKVSEKNGRIFLHAEDGNVEVSGTLVAEGGEVRVLGENVYLSDEAQINVSSANGGGTVLIGGDYQGKNPDIKNATRVSIEKRVQIAADALERGDGGKVIAFADGITHYEGNIFARGGQQEGDGGIVEVSGGTLGFYGKVDATAPFGKPGSLLLDPVDVTISSAATSGNMPALVCPFNQNFDGTPRNINNTELNACLNSGMSVTLDTSNFSGMDPGGTGNITIIDDVDYNSTADFTLMADNDITINSNRKIELTGNNTGTLLLMAGNDIHLLGDGAIEWRTGTVTLKAGNDLILDDTIGPPPPNQTRIRNQSGNIEITVGNDIDMGVETEITGASGGQQVLITVERDFRMADDATVNANSGDLNVFVGRDILTSNNSNINTDPNFEVTGQGNLFIEAGCNWISTGSAFAQSNAGNFTLIVDNAPPNDFSPFEGDCGIIFNGPSQLRTTSGLLRIYTACHTKNDFSQTEITGQDGIQEDAFFGKPFENATFPPTNIEQWETWFTSPGQPDPNAGNPFRVFYKCMAPPVPPNGNGNGNGNGFPGTIAGEFAIIGGFDPTFSTTFIANSVAENLIPYDACAFDNCCNFFNPPYMMGYDRCTYECCKAKEDILESYQVICDTCYYMINRAYIEYNTQGPLEWYNQKPWCCFQETDHPCNQCTPRNNCQCE